eukprot:gnl/MRDRNA2_/MRDRNA2_169125_c0_seq1.p1 gnl/MRDRNA2_/MRDRNA2_169125_c0~~gnl/MRDRNA2_/MRDRNA2_169125_c0_seq1.p1  ORF type:complete len:759 (+),score=127.36 gnl/MRDRNA2_/MRDRNA2_169125_c0_seq1:58-2334(+)
MLNGNDPSHAEGMEERELGRKGKGKAALQDQMAAGTLKGKGPPPPKGKGKKGTATLQEQVVLGIRTADGTLRSLQLGSTSCSVIEVKRKIFKAFQIPVEFQNLLNPSGEILKLSDSIEIEHVPELTLVVTLEEFCSTITNVPDADYYTKVIQVILSSRQFFKGKTSILTALTDCLQNRISTYRCLVLETLAEITEEGDEHVISAMITCLADENGGVRSAALEALPKVGAACERLVMAVIALLDHHNRDVRRSAIESLPKLAQKGDKRAISAAVARLDDHAKEVRCAALTCLSLMTKEGDDDVIGSLVTCLHDADSGVRFEALACATCIAKKGNELVIAAVLSALDDRGGYPDVSCCALQALPGITERGDQRAISAVFKVLEASNLDCTYTKDSEYHSTISSCTSCRNCERLVVALQVLPRITAKGDERVISLLVASFIYLIPYLAGLQGCGGDVRCWNNPIVRRAALNVLPLIAFKGDERVILAAIACLAHHEYEVRKTALEVLPQLAEKGHNHSVMAVVSLLEDQDDRVSHVAWKVLPRVVDKGNTHGVTAVVACLGKSVWQQALEALPQIAEKGDEQVVTATVAFLEKANQLHQKNPSLVQQVLRCAVLGTLPFVAERGNQATVNVILACLEVNDRTIRCAALSALAQVVEEGNTHAVTAIAACLEYDDQEVRCSSLMALVQVAGKGSQDAVTAVIARFEDREWKVRRTAFEVLAQIAEKGDKRAESAVQAHLEVKDWEEVRCAALDALAQIADHA